MKVLIVGLGSIGRRHMQVLRELDPHVEIFALRSTLTAVDVPLVHNIYSYNDIDNIDFIIISNPTSSHYQTIIDCLNLKRPLFIEKPLVCNKEELAGITKAIKQEAILAYVACNMRFHPTLTFLREYLETHKLQINEVNIYFGSYLPGWRPNRDFRQIYSANSSMGGGVHLDLIHEIDYCVWMFGQPLARRAIKQSRSSLKIDAIDYANYSLLYPPFTANIVLNYYRRDSKREIEIVTDDKTIHVDLITGKIRAFPEGDVLYSEPFEIGQTYLAQMSYFINCVNNNVQPMNGIDEAAKILKIALDD